MPDARDRGVKIANLAIDLDIAGPAWLDDADGENPKHGTGFGVRTLLELLTAWSD